MTVAAPAANYMPWNKTGKLVYTSGQLPFVDGKLFKTGLLGREEFGAFIGLGGLDPALLQIDRAKRRALGRDLPRGRARSRLGGSGK